MARAGAACCELFETEGNREGDLYAHSPTEDHLDVAKELSVRQVLNSTGDGRAPVKESGRVAGNGVGCWTTETGGRFSESNVKGKGKAKAGDFCCCL